MLSKYLTISAMVLVSSFRLYAYGDTINTDTILIPKSKLIFESSLSYINYKHNKGIRPIKYWDEWTWKMDVAVPVGNFRIGPRANFLFTKGDVRGKNNYKLLGGFLQYNLTPAFEKINVYLEANFMNGDYCPCQKSYVDEPFRMKGLNYAGAGFGMELLLRNNWYADVGFLTHNILNKIDPDLILQKSGYNIYYVGLKYHIKEKFNK